MWRGAPTLPMRGHPGIPSGHLAPELHPAEPAWSTYPHEAMLYDRSSALLGAEWDSNTGPSVISEASVGGEIHPLYLTPRSESGLRAQKGF